MAEIGAFRSSDETLRDLRTICRLQLSEVGQMIREAARQWLEDRGQRLGASLAFYTLLSMAPLVVIIVAVAGFVFGPKAAEGQLAWQVQNLVGPKEAMWVQTLIRAAYKPAVGSLATAASIATLFFSASSVVVELQDALNTIWHVPPGPVRSWLGDIVSFIKGRFYSFVVVLSSGILLLASLALSTWIAALGKWFHPFRIPEAALHVGIFVLSFLVIAFIFAAVYKVLPDVPLAWTDVIVGACVSSLLFTLGKQLIGLYLGKVSIGSAYGAAGSLVVILVWVYYSAQLFFLGAEFTKVYAQTRGSYRPNKVVEASDVHARVRPA
jgi:membrane protein